MQRRGRPHVVAGLDHDRIIKQPERFQPVLQPTEALVQPLDHAPIPRQALVLVALELQQIRRQPRPRRVALAVSVGRGVVVGAVLMVGLDEGEEEEEGLLARRLLRHEADGGVGAGVGAVARQLDGLVVVVKERRSASQHAKRG